MSDYKVTIDKEDFYDPKNVYEVILTRVRPKIKETHIDFIDEITGDVVESWPKKRVIHFIDLQEDKAELGLDV